MTATRSDALSLITEGRDAWALGDHDRALELVEAARDRLVSGGHTEATMPTTFDLINRIRAALLELYGGAA